MARLFLYPGIDGVYLLNQNFFIIDKILLKESDIIKSSQLLEQGRFTDAERALIKKHGKKADFEVIGFKTEKMEGVSVSQDIGKLGKISEQLRKDGGAIFKRLKIADTIATRHMIKNSVNDDTLIVQASSHMNELDRVANIMARRLREWYSYYLPEFADSIKDNEKFAEIVSKRSKEQLLRELRISKEQSLGADVKAQDVKPMLELANGICGIYRLQHEQDAYLKRLVEGYCPNMSAITGYSITAKLVAKAGSLRKLSQFPSSTVQILGAEEAFFRHLKTGAKMPKYGYIHEHPLIAKAEKAMVGRVARTLADKISIAARVDYFKGKFMGDKLKKDIEDKVRKMMKAR